MKKYILIAVVIILSGCAKTRMTFYQDPGFQGTSYNSFVVLSGFRNLEDRTYMETVFCAYLKNYNIACKRGIDVFPPTRTYSEAEFASTFMASGSDALVVFSLIDSYSTQTWVPPTVSTTGSITSYGNMAYFNATSTTSGGYMINKPVEEYEVFVIDGKTGKRSIIASGVAKGNAFAKPNHLSKSIAATFVKNLASNRIIYRK